MRLLLIEEDAHRCAHIRERLAGLRPQAQLVVRSPVAQGALAPEFLAQGFDAVLLADVWPGGRGLTWARELAGRTGFAPLVLLCGADASAARDAAAIGAYTLSQDDLDCDAFGDAFIRGYRCIRRLAAGPMTDLFVGESERAGTLVALKVARDRQDEQQPTFDMFRRFLQEYEIGQRINDPAVVRPHDLGVSDEHAWLVMEYLALGDLRRRMQARLTPRDAL